MPNKAFQSILEILASEIYILNKNGCRLYDIENPDFYINSITYESKTDKLIVKFKKDTENKTIDYNSTIKVLVDNIAAQFDVLNNHNYKLYDEEYQDCFIAGIEYNQEANAIFIKLDEEISYKGKKVI